MRELNYFFLDRQNDKLLETYTHSRDYGVQPNNFNIYVNNVSPKHRPLGQSPKAQI
jgi:hypothetical protein